MNFAQVINVLSWKKTVPFPDAELEKVLHVYVTLVNPKCVIPLSPLIKIKSSEFVQRQVTKIIHVLKIYYAGIYLSVKFSFLGMAKAVL